MTTHMTPTPITEDNIEAVRHWFVNPDRDLEALWGRADRCRRQHVGDAVHLRGLIEMSNHCIRQCRYCGINRDNADVFRYRLSDDEVLACARQAVSFGYGTVVIQAGEDYAISRQQVADLVGQIKGETPLAVTLSLGERPDEDLLAWRDAGADRYLLRFETGNPELYQRIHPDLGTRPSDRFAILSRLADMGYEVGSGIMVGIPGQTVSDVAADLLRFRAIGLDMIGIGPYLPHPATDLGRDAEAIRAATVDQCPDDLQTVAIAVALTRLLCPWANIPATTAVATVDTARGREDMLQRGANIVMPNLTPTNYRALYEIYPGKACISDTAEHCHRCLGARLRSIDRHQGSGRGDAMTREHTMSVAGALPCTITP